MSVATGVVLELGIEAISGRSEAWDTGLYWVVGLPIAMCIALALGFTARRSAWVWTVLIIPSQVFVMMVRSGEVSGLLPLAVVLSALLSMPFVVAAFLASRLRRLVRSPETP